MPDLQIYDVSGYVHTAAHVSTFSGRSSRMFPVGGIHFFLRALTTALRMGDNVACSFDSKSPSVPKYDGYKGNRTIDPKVVAQCEFLYDFLRKCGIACYKGHGESDDLIYNIVEAHKHDENMGVYRIYVNGSDYDLCHNVDDECVEYRTCNSNTNNVNWINFPKAIGWGDEPILFNTLLAYKVFCGKKADNIKPFVTSDGRKGIDLYKLYKAYWNSATENKTCEVMRSRIMLEKFISIVIKDSRDVEELGKRMDCIYPKDLRRFFKDGFKVTDREGADLQLLCDYAYALNDRTSMSTLKKMGFSPRGDDSISDILSEVFDLGKDFSNGRWIASKGLNMARSSTFSERVSVKDI